METFENNLQTIATETGTIVRIKHKLEVRLVAIERFMARTKAGQARGISLAVKETLDDFSNHLLAVHAELVDSITSCNHEISKIEKGRKDLETLTDKAGQAALASYIATDTTLSAKNLNSVLCYYDELIATYQDIALFIDKN